MNNIHISRSAKRCRETSRGGFAGEDERALLRRELGELQQRAERRELIDAESADARESYCEELMRRELIRIGQLERELERRPGERELM